MLGCDVTVRKLSYLLMFLSQLPRVCVCVGVCVCVCVCGFTINMTALIEMFTLFNMQ